MMNASKSTSPSTNRAVATLHSPLTLICLGLNETTAEHIYKAWLHLDSSSSTGFCTSPETVPRKEPKISIQALPTDWTRVLQRIGVGEVLISAITKPASDDVRLTKSEFEWVEEAMDMRWEGLMWRIGIAIDWSSRWLFQKKICCD